VKIEANPDCSDKLRWFYGELIGLHDVTELENEVLRFRSHEFELRVKLTNEPRIESVAVRVHVWVPSLTSVKTELRDCRMEFEEHQGLTATDRRIHVLDPGGNRVEIRRGWFGSSV
jgi:hypothetical protein